MIIVSTGTPDCCIQGEPRPCHVVPMGDLAVRCLWEDLTRKCPCCPPGAPAPLVSQGPQRPPAVGPVLGAEITAGWSNPGGHQVPPHSTPAGHLLPSCGLGVFTPNTNGHGPGVYQTRKSPAHHPVLAGIPRWAAPQATAPSDPVPGCTSPRQEQQGTALFLTGRASQYYPHLCPGYGTLHGHLGLRAWTVTMRCSAGSGTPGMHP